MLKTKMYVFAGKGPDCIKYNDIWVFDTNQTMWSKVKVKETIESVIPEGRSGHSMFQL
jgi:N-acetylneuraminic acid mutarotase